MQQFTKRLTYANVMSTIAVFLVLGGATAVAATTLGKNSVGANQLKRNAVTTAKLKNNSVTTAKIGSGAVTGSKIKLSTLGAVPTATNAGHASTADTATNAGHASSAVNATNATNFSRYFTSGIKKASVGETVTLGSAGPFTVIGKCTEPSAGEFEAAAYITTSAPDSFMYSAEAGNYQEANFQPGEEAELPYGISDSSPDWAAYNGYYSDWSAASPDGSVLLQGFSNEGIDVFGATCAFNVSWTNNG